jgi:sugar phosphate isomerase/epimerase
MAAPLQDYSRLCLHTITTKPWALEEAVHHYAQAGVKGITVWRDSINGNDAAGAGRLIRDHGLSIVSLCRGGFFPATTVEGRAKALDDNLRCIDQAVALGAPLIVLVCGAVPGQPLTESRAQITEGIATLLPSAAAAGVKLAIEPLHPMYAADRSAVNTIGQARAICQSLGSPWLGVAIDVYHVWWDHQLEQEIAACGRERVLLAFHICDWKAPMADPLNDRGLMGEGCIPIRQIRGWVERAGFTGFNEVEIFSHRYWAGDQVRFLADIQAAYLSHT